MLALSPLKLFEPKFIEWKKRKATLVLIFSLLTPCIAQNDVCFDIDRWRRLKWNKRTLAYQRRRWTCRRLSISSFGIWKDWCDSLLAVRLPSFKLIFFFLSGFPAGGFAVNGVAAFLKFYLHCSLMSEEGSFRLKHC